jgi:hypothetical protein
MQMKTRFIVTIAALAFAIQTAFALSRDIGRDIEFPKDYEPAKQKAILAVVRDQRFKFVSGLVSYWPPDWSTRLSFAGDAKSLSDFLVALRGIDGVGFRLVLYKGRDDEQRRDSTWQLDFSKAHPDLLTIHVNILSKELDLAALQLPEWKGK